MVINLVSLSSCSGGSSFFGDYGNGEFTNGNVTGATETSYECCGFCWYPAYSLLSYMTFKNSENRVCFILSIPSGGKNNTADHINLINNTCDYAWGCGSHGTGYVNFMAVVESGIKTCYSIERGSIDYRNVFVDREVSGMNYTDFVVFHTHEELGEECIRRSMSFTSFKSPMTTRLLFLILFLAM